MANMEPLDNNDDIDKPDESDEINMDVTCDESDNDESSETYDSNEEESLLNTAMKNLRTIGQQTTTTTNSPNKTNSTGNLNKSAIDIFNESIGDIHYEESRRGENTRATIVNEFQNYRKYATQFNLKHKPDATSAIIFWRTYGDTFSILRGLAKKMLSTPATSVPSESCFSLSSSLGRKERVCLTGDNLSSSVFLKDKINF
ncbi:unnamed protein product [Rotaria magnacalcarata]|uniref:HAT C-terminal dimerisation domain-containing protein n=3 Tax=Rotaria magnacalcarata TaxID=392030 RepID=A0A816A4D4_9BILA|nr:unnamed protein product [Rotaria magnacalcarata]